MIKVHYTYGTGKKQPAAGDVKTVKRTGQIMIRQQVRHGSAWVVSRNRPVWEWVVKGGERDRSAKRMENAADE